MGDTERVRALYLTDNPNLGASARVLLDWLPLGERTGVEFAVVLKGRGPLSRWLESRGFPHRLSPMPWPDRRRPWRSAWEAWGVARWARRHRCRLIHCEHMVYPFAALVRRLSGLPLVCHVHYSIPRPFAVWAFGRPSRRPDMLLWTTRQQQLDCREAVEGIVPGHRQEVVPLGVGTATFGAGAGGRAATRRAWGVGPDEVVIGAANALRPRKRVEDFVTLVAGLARDDPRVVGVIAGDAVPGDEPYRERILRQIDDTGLGRRLIWLGNLDEIGPFLHAIDIFVSTSEYETFGMSVCEAMACGRPVAAYRGGSVHEVVGAAGRVVATGDLPALAGAVAGLVADAGLRRELGELALRRVAAEFDPARSLQRLGRIYGSVLRRGRPAVPAGGHA
jgi:glycosyltransferase involved in cell wall biosynthesis